MPSRGTLAVIKQNYMLRRKSILIDIPKPCSENWDEMEVTINGRFCHSCQKEVIDFSSMNDEEILIYFKNYKHFCGSFNEFQLNRNLSIESKKRYSKFRQFVAMLVTFLSIKSSSILALNRKIETIQVSTNSIDLMVLEKQEISDSYKITGIVTVTDSTLLQNTPIHVKIANTNIDVQTDASGNYEIVISKELMKQYTIISFYHPNLKHETRTIHISSFPQILNIEMDRPPSGRIGGMPVPYYNK